MRAVLLAAGYGTSNQPVGNSFLLLCIPPYTTDSVGPTHPTDCSRLKRDLQNDTSGQFSHLVGTPKPLLPIGGLPLISHWIKAFDQVPEITSVVVVTNDLHKPL
ncbi:hypothetical protein E2C01_059182 [Portunus trituberculatus]|uniref:Uncharacterized protein n=1 Tax=Portunus trituberculatus TaxID=210409 RepID=A0A5B7H7M9_PORTR|nr:hypothetical protein [Portunus trituberculatus]